MQAQAGNDRTRRLGPSRCTAARRRAGKGLTRPDSAGRGAPGRGLPRRLKRRDRAGVQGRERSVRQRAAKGRTPGRARPAAPGVACSWLPKSEDAPAQDRVPGSQPGPRAHPMHDFPSCQGGARRSPPPICPGRGWSRGGEFATRRAGGGELAGRRRPGSGVALSPPGVGRSPLRHATAPARRTRRAPRTGAVGVAARGMSWREMSPEAGIGWPMRGSSKRPGRLPRPLRGGGSARKDASARPGVLPFCRPLRCQEAAFPSQASACERTSVTGGATHPPARRPLALGRRAGSHFAPLTPAPGPRGRSLRCSLVAPASLARATPGVIRTRPCGSRSVRRWQPPRRTHLLTTTPAWRERCESEPLARSPLALRLPSQAITRLLTRLPRGPTDGASSCRPCGSAFAGHFKPLDESPPSPLIASPGALS
jgi:hypothetical protein